MDRHKLAVNQGKKLDNYLLYLKGLGYTSSRLLTHKEMYRSHLTTELAIPDPA